MKGLKALAVVIVAVIVVSLIEVIVDINLGIHLGTMLQRIVHTFTYEMCGAMLLATIHWVMKSRD